eukprot:CAMPEP_0170179764 /NCGR_PEP_ID=MMETSP0040_2-20121228/19112_1 /TAXON_ID=641309 /ORGANISM="Lotharella oceanica, Strain CCMP622" /LENGTH=243 /DNA_ID=CAMNT_0010424055 /DNA_START=68 /DNA_END=799 /DNA_ORIENTATION=+
MVPGRDQAGKKDEAKPTSYIHVCEPYELPKGKLDPKDPKNKPKAPWKSAHKYDPAAAVAKGNPTYVGPDDGCFSRYVYVENGYGHSQSYKDKSLATEKKAQQCHKGAPFGSKNAPRRDEFHQHIAQLQWKELLEKEKTFEMKIQKEGAAKASKQEAAAPKPKKKIHAFDRVKGMEQEGAYNNTWKSQTHTWIQKKGYGIKQINSGTMKTSSNGYGNFDLNAIERPKHARVSVTKEFNDISHLG